MEVKDKLIDAADSYDNFTGLDESMDGSVKFVMKVQANDTKKESKNSESKNTKDNSNDNKDKNKNFIEWLKSKFNK